MFFGLIFFQMNVEDFYNFCKNIEQAQECFPFSDDILVFKVEGKIFAICFLRKKPSSIILKCDVEESKRLRQEYEGITPGYHMNKKHWISVEIGKFSDDFVSELILNSFELVRAKNRLRGNRKLNR